MHGLGDLFDKLARNAGMSIGDRMQLRSKGRDLDALGPAISQLFGPGETDPHFSNFYAAEGEFGTLPHPMASLYSAAAANDIASGTTFNPLTTAVTAATWTKGIGHDPGNALILGAGLPVGSVVEFTLWAEFEANSTGNRAMRWIELTGSSAVNVYEHSPNASSSTWLHIVHKRLLEFEDTTYQLQVYQDSGGALEVQGYIVAERVR